MLDIMGGNPPRVAVLLAAFNGMKWIDAQISSILEQSGVEIELFVSVDASIDGTFEYCRSLAVARTNITLLPDVGRLGGAAKNFYRLLSEVDLSRFDFVAFADQDDIWLPEKLKRGCAQLVDHCADGYSSNVMAFWPNGRKRLIRKDYPQRSWDFLFESAGPGCSYLLTGRLALEFQEFVRSNKDVVNQFFLHDWLVYAFARARGFRWIIDSKVSLLYRQHESNAFGANSGGPALLSRVKAVCGGWAFSQIATLCHLVGLENDPFLQRCLTLDRAGFFRLGLAAGECRRRLRDRIAMFALCLWLSVVGIKKA